MNRRRFTFWLGFGLFGLAEKFRIDCFDNLAAAAMRSTEPAAKPKSASNKPKVTPIHWRFDDDDTWRWFERESFVDGKWSPTGITRPIHKLTGEPKEGDAEYLDDVLVPAGMLLGEFDLDANIALSSAEFSEHHPSAKFRARHGRPPSKWLRSLDADELRIWLKTVKVPEAGVSGMTYWEHLTRDHSFNAARIEGLSEKEQAKLHAAAHYGY